MNLYDIGFWVLKIASFEGSGYLGFFKFLLLDSSFPDLSGNPVARVWAIYNKARVGNSPQMVVIVCGNPLKHARNIHV